MDDTAPHKPWTAEDASGPEPFTHTHYMLIVEGHEGCALCGFGFPPQNPSRPAKNEQEREAARIRHQEMCDRIGIEEGVRLPVDFPLGYHVVLLFKHREPETHLYLASSEDHAIDQAMRDHPGRSIQSAQLA